MKSPGRHSSPARRATLGPSFDTPDGVRVLLEPSRELPLVDLQLALRTGSVFDPEGREGLTRLVGRMIRMGTAHLDGNEVEEKIARLGARLTVETSPSFVRLHGAVIRRNLEPFVQLLSELVRLPAFRRTDIAHVKRETVSDIVASRDNDRGLSGRNFRAHLFDSHLYARPVVGTRASVRSIQREDVLKQYRAHYVASNMVLGAAGDLSMEDLTGLVERHFTDMPHGRAPTRRIGEPVRPKGRRIILVDKPERTQTQLFMGGLGAKVKDKDLYDLSVANTAFGGTFTARLMNEVRSKRGWSYGAYSRLGQDRHRDAWYMWTFPAAKDVAACIELQLRMLEELVGEGIRQKELRFAKNYMINSHCFDVDTAAKRLDARIECELFDLPPDDWQKYVNRVRAVSLADANGALKRRLSAKHVLIVLVATAKDLREELAALPGIDRVDVVPHDRD